MATLAFSKVSGYIVQVIGETNPSDAEWTAYVRFLQEGGLIPGVAPRILAFSYGGVPNVAQRHALNTLAERGTEGLRVAVVTSSKIGRGVVTALSWFAKDGYKAFSPEDLQAALEYLEIPKLLTPQIKSVLIDLSSKVGIPPG